MKSVELLEGRLAERHGSKPKVELPGDDMLLIEFARQLASILKDKGLYRRDTVAVVPNDEQRRVGTVTCSTFRSLAEEHIVCFKTRYTNEGVPYDVLRTMPGETADGVLSSRTFWRELPVIIRVNPVPMPMLRKDNQIVLQTGGYDHDTQTLTFK